MKAETASEGSGSGSTTAVATPETASIAESAADTEHSEEASTANGTQSQVSGNGKGKKDKRAQTLTAEGVKPESKSSTTNLSGKLNNLVTTDLQNIIDGRDFMLIGTSFFMI